MAFLFKVIITMYGTMNLKRINMFVLPRLSCNSGYDFFTGFCFLCEELQDSNMLDLDPHIYKIIFLGCFIVLKFLVLIFLSFSLPAIGP